MGKVLKAIGIGVLMIGASILIGPGGAFSIPSMLLAAGIASTLSGLATLAFAPKIPQSQLSRLNVSLDTTTPRKAVFGTTAMPLDLRYHEAGGTNQEYVDYIIVTSAHKVISIDQIWFEDKLAWSSSGGVTSRYTGYLTVATRTEGTAANTININGGSKWGSTRRLTGCSYVHLRVRRTGITNKAESPLVNGLPPRVTIIGNGALLYDPRKDSTVIGGSGTHRANNQSTWGSYTNADDCDNPALQLLWWLLGWKINGVLSVGCGVPANRIDLESFITAANICDENIVLASGGTQKRYRTSGTATDADDRMSIINTFLTSMNGTLRDNEGKLTLTAIKNDLANYVLTFDDNDVLDSFEWNQTRGLSDTYNVARGRYVDPSSSSLYQLVDFPEVRIASPDGIERVMTVDLPYVEDGKRAQRIAKQVLQRNQYRGMFSATFTAKAMGCQVGDIVRMTFSPLGWSNKLFRVVGQQIDMSGQVPLVLIEENAAIYAWDKEEKALVTPTAPTVYDPLNNPFILAISDATTVSGYLTNESHTVAAASNGTGYSLTSAGGSFKIYDGDTDVSSSGLFSVVGSSTKNGLTIGINSSGVYSLSGSAWSSDSETFTLQAVYGSLTIQKDYSIAKSKAGVDGSAAPLIFLSSTAQTFTYDGAGTASPSYQTITFTATIQNLTETPTFSATGYNSSGTSLGSITLSGTGNTRTMTNAQFGSAAYAVVTVSISGLSDTVTVVKLRDGAQGSTGETGPAGASAKTLTLISDRQTIAYDAAGNPTPTTQTTNFSVNKQNSTATVSWSITDAAGTARTPVTSYLSADTGDAVTMTQAQFASARNGTAGVIVTATMSDGGSYSDRISVVRVQQGADGVDPIVGYLTNESITLAADSSGTVASFASATGTFKVFQGTTDQTTSAAFSVTVQTGCTVSINASTGVYSVSAMSSDSATATLQAVYGGVTLEKRLSLAKSRAGATGAPGSTGETGPAGASAYLTNEAIALFAYANGNVVSYSPASGTFKVFAGSTDISSSFTLATLSNPQSLSVTYTGMAYSITGGFDPEEDTATLTIRATGSGSYAGVTFDKIVTLSKQKGGYEIVSALPTTDLFEGRMVFLTTDDKLYRYTGSTWTKAVDGADIQPNSILTNSIGAGQITAAQLASTELITLSAQIGTAVITGAKIGDLEVNTLKIANNAVNAVVTSYGGAGTVSDTLDVDFGSVSLSTIGGIVRIDISFDSRRSSGSTSVNLTAQIVRVVGTTETVIEQRQGASSASFPPTSFFITDSPGAGSVSYKARFSVDGGSGSFAVSSVSFAATEIRR